MMDLMMVLMFSTSVLQALSPASLLVEEWQRWKAEHNKTYDRLEYGSAGGSKVSDLPDPIAVYAQGLLIHR